MKVFLIAGEASGDVLGAALMAGLRALRPDVTFTGIGGPEMAAEGLTSRFPMDELSVMGLAEVLPKYFHLKRRIAETAEAIIADPPNVLITIDSPDFCLRVVKQVKTETSVHAVHYVAPSVWAWRPKRADKMAEIVDHVLALLPFEPPYMEAAGVACDFVGHPAATIEAVTEADCAAFRTQYGVEKADPLILVLPGSRKGEVTRLGPRIGAALDALVEDHPNMHLVLPAAAPVADLVREVTRGWKKSPIILDPRGKDPEAARHEKRVAFAACDVAVATSGTVALELAVAETPMVSVYDVSWLTRQIVRHMLKVDTGNLVNLVTDSRVVSECLGDDCTPENIAQALRAVIDAPDTQREAMRACMTALGRGGEAPGLRAARAVLQRLPV